MKQKFYLVILIFLIFFAISFLTNILGSINPNVSDSFSLNGTMTGMLPFSFFIAYALMSIPSGMLIQRYQEKKGLVSAWVLAFFGALLFSLLPGFPVFLCSLFMIGSGMALLQVALFPLLRVTGGEEHFAFNNMIVQLVFGAASFLSPFVYSYLVSNLGSQVHHDLLIRIMSLLTPERMHWISIYWLFAFISFIMIVIIMLVRFPEVVRKEDEVVGAWDIHIDLFRQKTVILFFFGIFSYVGVEQGIANWISEFLRTYHGIKPETGGAATVGLFWGMMTVGCFLGLILLKIIDSKIVLRIFTSAAIAVLLITLFGKANISMIGFPVLGFCLSVMYGIIFSLALNSVPKYHGSFSGILCTAIAGGAVFSLLIGKLKDIIGLQSGMLILILPLSYILSLSFWARPIISNAIFKRKNSN
ncbi:MAG: MFS transporter [Bacteroidales bacterium]|jgi:fucose permease